MTIVRLALALLLFASGPGWAGDTLLDQVFAKRPERNLMLNAYLPASKEPAPVLLYVYGGSYISGDRNVLSEQGAVIGLRQHGVAVITFDYRYSSEAVFPAQAHDVTAAMCWLRDSAPPELQQRLNLKKLVLWGHSAGGHLAMLGAVGAHSPEIMDPSCGDELPAATGVVSYFGVSDFDGILNARSTDAARNIVEQLFGGPLEQHPDRVQQASVLNKLGSHSPPALLVHGDADPRVPYQQSVQLMKAYRANRLPVTLMTIPGGMHGRGGPPGQGFGSRVLADHTRDFILRQLE